MKIAFVTPEAYPFAKTGGLGDVSYSLPRALAKRGHEVILIMPRYYGVDKRHFGLHLVHAPLPVPFAYGELGAALYGSNYVPEVPAYFIEYDAYFGRDGLYNDGYYDYPDNAERYAFFAKAALEAVKALEFEPDIIHCNDWQTGLLPVFKKNHYRADPFFDDTGIVLTIHNVGYQGVFHKNVLHFAQLGWDIFTMDGLEYFDQINYLKGGVIFADAVTAVSRKYALEIQTPEFGYNLAPLFYKLNHKLFGITNGVDYDKWNPASDFRIPATFSAQAPEGKTDCKRQLQKRMDIRVNDDIPLIASITRLTHQKGMDVCADALEQLLPETECQFVILGLGEQWIIDRFESLRRRYPDRVGLYWGHSEELAHWIEAGADIFVMPSRYEPCGLNQMYSLKYGTIPIVRATGGLDDTVEEWDPRERTGNGFKFRDLHPAELGSAIKKVLRVFANKPEWRELQKNAFAYSYTWDDAVSEYEEVYRFIRRGAGSKYS